MSQKQLKPVLSGQRLKGRKRNEKVKYDPSAFSSAIIGGIRDANGDFEALNKYLDTAGNRLDYRRYAEALFDILIAGGVLAPGGAIEHGDDVAPMCLFAAEAGEEAGALEPRVEQYVDVFNKLIRRYKYLQLPFEEEMQKVLKFLKGFKREDRKKLALACAHFIDKQASLAPRGSLRARSPPEPLACRAAAGTVLDPEERAARVHHEGQHRP